MSCELYALEFLQRMAGLSLSAASAEQNEIVGIMKKATYHILTKGVCYRQSQPAVGVVFARYTAEPLDIMIKNACAYNKIVRFGTNIHQKGMHPRKELVKL